MITNDKTMDELHKRLNRVIIDVLGSSQHPFSMSAITCTIIMILDDLEKQKDVGNWLCEFGKLEIR